jgi:hypothetical protein
VDETFQPPYVNADGSINRDEIIWALGDRARYRIAEPVDCGCVTVRYWEHTTFGLEQRVFQKWYATNRQGNPVSGLYANGVQLRPVTQGLAQGDAESYLGENVFWWSAPWVEPRKR